jgi:hypothetical protein
VHIVVVEDHRRGHRREQPADVGVGPTLPVELRVLVEVEHAPAGRLVHVAASLEQRHRRRRDLVGVDLVAEHQQHVGPLLTWLLLHALGERAQSVDLAAALVLVLGQGVGRGVWRRDPAGAEQDLERTLLRIGLEGAPRAPI